MQRTKIEYLTHTWNPVDMRCTPVSEGCERCWHLALRNRFCAQKGLPALWRWHEMLAPIDLPSSAMIGVQLMGDLFHEQINIYGKEMREIFRVMAGSEATFLLLTKRPKRMKKCIENIYGDELAAICPNVWLGVTAENQRRSDERIPTLVSIPAAVRWVSIEPMLGSINILWALRPQLHPDLPCIGWVICGGETGPGARQMHPAWARDLRDQCKEAGVPFFFKKMGDGWKNWSKHIPCDDLEIREFPERK